MRIDLAKCNSLFWFIILEENYYRKCYNFQYNQTSFIFRDFKIHIYVINQVAVKFNNITGFIIWVYTENINLYFLWNITEEYWRMQRKEIFFHVNFRGQSASGYFLTKLSDGGLNLWEQILPSVIVVLIYYSWSKLLWKVL